jgi:hypothetical protein
MIPFFKKVFECIHDVEFDENQDRALALIAQEGERLELRNCYFRSNECEEVFSAI